MGGFFELEEDKTTADKCQLQKKEKEFTSSVCVEIIQPHHHIQVEVSPHHTNDIRIDMKGFLFQVFYHKPLLDGNADSVD